MTNSLSDVWLIVIIEKGVSRIFFKLELKKRAEKFCGLFKSCTTCKVNIT